MDMIEIKNISTKDKKHLINNICLMYNRIIKSESMIYQNKLTASDSALPKRKLLNLKPISIFRTVLELLPKEQKEIIEKDFIDKANAYWYVDKYSKTTYYRLKNESMNNFLFLLYK